MSTKRSLASQAGRRDWMERLLSLNESAIRPVAETEAGATSPGNVLNGEGISMKSPRINTDGAMPTIW